MFLHFVFLLVVIFSVSTVRSYWNKSVLPVFTCCRIINQQINVSPAPKCFFPAVPECFSANYTCGLITAAELNQSRTDDWRKGTRSLKQYSLSKIWWTAHWLQDTKYIQRDKLSVFRLRSLLSFWNLFLDWARFIFVIDPAFLITCCVPYGRFVSLCGGFESCCGGFSLVGNVAS